MNNKERLMQVILKPITTEKTTGLADKANTFSFKVLPSATKKEVQGAVELLFNVEVVGVQTTNVKGKTKRTGARMGKRSDWKKAYVRLKDGQDIDFATA